jgi:adenylate kinase
MRIVLLGAPGSGKGTQAALLREKYAIPHISTGDILRSEVARGTKLGKKAEPFMKTGTLVPDEIILGMIESRLAEPDAKRGWILDGFPRTLAQARGFVELTDRIGQRPDAGLILNVGTEVVVRRLSGRRVCASCGTVTNVADASAARCPKCGGELRFRDDDEPEVVRRRMQVFDVETRPVFELFRARYPLHEIDASEDLESVASSIEKVLGERV